jgi:lipoprotein-releasing system ATP-binding protein
MLIAEELTKTYRRNADSVRVLTGVSLTVQEGEFLSIVGMSGSGKSTFLHLLGTLDQPDSGRILLEGKRIDNLSNRERDKLRNTTFGFVFQFYHLLPELNAIDNVLMPAYINQSLFGWLRTRKEWRKRAEAILDRVGLSHRKTHKPRELSGGEMQRAAVARALLCKPRVLLADEPTGNLDYDKGQEIVKLLKELNEEDRVTIVMVTHNLELAYGTDRVVKMAGGRLVEELADKGHVMGMPQAFRPRLAATA